MTSSLPRLLVGLLSLGAASFASTASAKIQLEKIRLPEGFAIEVLADDLPGARSLALGPKGTLVVGTRDDKVYALKLQDGKRVGKPIVVASGLNSPNGVAFKDGALFVAEIQRVTRYDRFEEQLNALPKPKVILETLPKDTHHGWKFIAFGPDGKLYVPVGAPCNICEKPDPYASLLRMNADGTGQEVFARGIRNTVGFDWDPKTLRLWFSDNGRDWLGDDSPPDELNQVAKAGQHFGYPFCHAGRIADPDFGAKRKCEEFVKPAAELGAHVAALGLRFYQGRSFPAAYQGRILIAEHGSWNRSVPSGYRITQVDPSGDTAKNYRTFAEGWLSDGAVWGRPVDLLTLPDGSLIVSDDMNGALYRIRYGR